MKWQPKHPAMQTLVRAFIQETAPVYVVGGVVRDHLLQRETALTDLDLVIEQNGLAVARRVADRLGWAYYPLDADRDVARLVFNTTSGPALVCDVAGLRGGSLTTDLLSRDFTVNALAFVLERKGSNPYLVDVCGGLSDLEQRLVRRVTVGSFADDPVRLLRAVRFVHQLDFTLESETAIQIKRMGATVKLASAERIRDELWKLLAMQDPAAALADLNALGLLPQVLPEVALMAGVMQSPPHDVDVFEHTLRVVTHAAEMRAWLADGEAAGRLLAPWWAEALSRWRTPLRQHFAQPLAVGRLRRDWLVWCALLHDIGKPATHSVEIDTDGQQRIRFIGHERVSAERAGYRLAQLRFSRHEIELAQAVVDAHMRPHHLHAAFTGQPISRRAAFRFFRDIGGRQFSHLAGLDTLLVALADFAGTSNEPSPEWPVYLAHIDQLCTFAFASDGLQQTQQRPILDGHTLMQSLHLQPGRQVGEILDHVLEAQAAGEVQTLEDALALAASWLNNQTN
jgi:poly(A) polymerase